MAPSETRPVMEQSTQMCTSEKTASRPYGRASNLTFPHRSSETAAPSASTTTAPRHSASGGDVGGANARVPVPSSPPRGRYLIGTASSGTVTFSGSQHDTAPTTVNEVEPGSRLAVRKFLTRRMSAHAPSASAQDSPSGGRTTAPSRTTTPRSPVLGPANPKVSGGGLSVGFEPSAPNDASVVAETTTPSGSATATRPVSSSKEASKPRPASMAAAASAPSARGTAVDAEATRASSAPSGVTPSAKKPSSSSTFPETVAVPFRESAITPASRSVSVGSISNVTPGSAAFSYRATRFSATSTPRKVSALS